MNQATAWSSLQPGDKILVIAPSGSVQKEAYPQIIDMFQQWGLQPVVPADLAREGGGYFQWPNTPQRRAEHIIQGLNDPSIKAIFALEGGEGALEVAEILKQQKQNFLPRSQAIPLIGYSDIGQLHTYLGQSGLISPVYGPTIEYLADFGNNDEAGKAVIAGNREALRQFLMGNGTREPEQTILPLNATAKEIGTVSGITVMPNGMAENSSHRVELLPNERYILMVESRSADSLRNGLLKWQQRPGMVQIDGIVIGRYTDNQTLTGSLNDAELGNIQKLLDELNIIVPVYYGATFGHAKWGQNASPIRPTPLHTHAEIHGNGEHATLAMDRFRAQSEVDAYRKQPPAPRLAERQSFPLPKAGILKATINIVQQYPDASDVLNSDTRGKILLLEFSQPDINTMHIALSDLLVAGKLDDVVSLRITSPQPISDDTKRWLTDFQQLHMPGIPVTTLELPTASRGEGAYTNMPPANRSRRQR